MNNSILFDIGATKTRMAYTADGQVFEEPKVWETPLDYAGVLKVFLENCTALAQGRGVRAICGGASRAVVGSDYGRFKGDLERSFEAKVLIENDAAMAGLGEACFGAGRGFGIVAYITVSTGVGGARIVGDQIDERAIGFEPGKQIMDIESGETLEGLISGKALEKRTGSHPKDIADPAVWAELARSLAFGLNNIIVEWSPDCVVLGGSMITGDPAIPLETAEEQLRNILNIYPKLPPIKKAELHDFGGLYGALAYLKEK